MMNVLGFHFIRPEWLWLLPVHVVLICALLRSSGATPWAAHLPKAALEVLSIGRFSPHRFERYWLAVTGLSLIIAAAGPSWVKQSAPSLNNQSATIILLDLSPSMLSEDIQPDRITRARYELLDLLDRQKDGQVGLIAYGGSAHIVSPLTDDADTIKALVPALSPTIIPERGSNAEAAIRLAQRLLNDAGVSRGNLVLITDGVSDTAKEQILRDFKRTHTLSILGVGGRKLAPIPEENGGFLKDSNGQIVLTKLEFNGLRELASSTGGRATTLFPDTQDTDILTNNATTAFAGDKHSDSQPQENHDYDQWQDMGYLLILLTLPIVVLLFRKGAVYCLALFLLAPMPFDATAESTISLAHLFQTQNQRAAALMQKGKHAEAADTFENEDWSAVANYKAKNYEATITDLDNKADAISLYNKANAQALNGQLEAAIESYNAVLTLEPGHEDAEHNKAFLEQLIKQQDPQNQNQDSQQGGEQNQEQGQNPQDQQQSGSDSNNGQESENQTPSSDNNQQQQESPSSAKQDDTNSLSEQSEQQANSSEPTDDQQEQTSDNQTSQPENQAGEGETQQESLINDQTRLENERPGENDPSAPPSLSEQTTVIENNEQSLSDSSEQWLRSIGEDPSGLLRRKFEYQAWQRQQQQKNQQRNRTSNSAKEQRY